MSSSLTSNVENAKEIMLSKEQKAMVSAIRHANNISIHLDDNTAISFKPNKEFSYDIANVVLNYFSRYELNVR